MNKKVIVMTIACIAIIFLFYSSIQVILQGSPEITYEVLKYEELPEEVLARLDLLDFDPFENDAANLTFKIRTGKDTYIFLKPPKGFTVKVLEVRIDEIWFNTLEYKYTNYGEEGIDSKSAMRIIKINNYLGGITGIFSSGE
ncbi:hypothetical protein [Fusibacter ferrireducens]|uniref:DUF4825 domain-containing protein n=1 Tax=Fusibacter ferrireducens TaxID=2785058 RepID=A0ABR9ZNA5_9FIRM|nr:hypothetical protein [Fusibacter ferrireducens]MBF4691948.1 hypothetical protein [Fusibacter ferrireducens]